MSTTGSQSNEFKLTSLTAGVGALGVLIEMVRGGQVMSENVMIALLIAVTLIGISYNISRGMAKYEHTSDAPDAPATASETGAKSSEFKLTAAMTGAGVLPLLLELLQGQETVSDKLTIVLIGCITATIISFNVSRGLARYEHRGEPPSSVPPGASPGV